MAISVLYSKRYDEQYRDYKSFIDVLSKDKLKSKEIPSLPWVVVSVNTNGDDVLRLLAHSDEIDLSYFNNKETPLTNPKYYVSLLAYGSRKIKDIKVMLNDERLAKSGLENVLAEHEFDLGNKIEKVYGEDESLNYTRSGMNLPYAKRNVA